LHGFCGEESEPLVAEEAVSLEAIIFGAVHR
jgi:hypothetical protein